MITTVSAALARRGRITAWWIPTPPTNETSSVTANAGQYEKPWLVVSVHAMYVENIAISPCAKLITPVARWISTIARASAP